MVRALEQRADYLALADAVLLLDTADGRKVISDERVSQLAGKEREAANQVPTGSALKLRRRAQLTRALRRARNRPGGYWVAAADPQAASQAVTGTLPRKGLYRAPRCSATAPAGSSTRSGWPPGTSCKQLSWPEPRPPAAPRVEESGRTVLACPAPSRKHSTNQPGSRAGHRPAGLIRSSYPGVGYGMAHELRQGVGGGGASQLRSSRCSVLHLASCHHQTGVPTGSSAADGRLQPIGVNAGACQKPRDQRV